MPTSIANTPSRQVIVARGPFELSAAVDVLRTWQPVTRFRPAADDVVRLAFALDGTFTPAGAALRALPGGVEVEVAAGPSAVVVAQVARMFALDVDGSAYPAVGERDAAVGRLMDSLPGLRPVAFPSPYEAAAWAVLSQRISMAQAARVLDTVLAEHGTRVEVAGRSVVAFPGPEALLRLDAVAGATAEKVARLHSVARAALDGVLDPAVLRDLDPAEAEARLRSIRGIGPFWASGIHLRGCNVVDVFPPEPLAVAALGITHGLGERPAPADIEAIAAAWRPFRMWVCFLLRVAAGRGLVPGIAGREMAIRRRARPASGEAGQESPGEHRTSAIRTGRRISAA